MRIGKKIESNEFLTLVELVPPKGVDVSSMVSTATSLQNLVDAFVVPDMSRAVMHMSALGAAVVLQNNCINTVMHVCCRDRNRLALQADLLAAYACGIADVLAAPSDEPEVGDHHEAKPVHDIQLLGLLDVLEQLRRGRDLAGTDLQGAPQFVVGSTANAMATGAELEREVEEVAKKRDRGVAYFVTPPLFSVTSIEPFLKAVDGLRVTIVPSVLVLKSAGMARYVNTHVGNVQVPEDLIRRIRASADAARECVRIAAETVSALKREGLGGVVVAALGWESRIPEILQDRG